MIKVIVKQKNIMEKKKKKKKGMEKSSHTSLISWINEKNK